ncbi:hypothetical protein AX17_003842 [Amanita inopinata Kibby_2008]|nr:hypothetical protein AX17_003842 [Amanita inopinata Kibby_2008]
MISSTCFDSYFIHASSRSQTSSNLFSSLVPPLTPEEYAQGIQSAQSTASKLDPIRPALLASDQTRSQLFHRFLIELNQGFNLLFYGFGSKRRVLDGFARECCAKAGHVVVANTFRPDFTLKELFTTIEGIPGVLELNSDAGPSSTTVENRARRIYDAFCRPLQKQDLYLIVHNIDALPLRTPKAKTCLAHLAMNPRIHIVASIDHINAPLLWSLSECATRKRCFSFTTTTDADTSTPPPSPSPSSSPSPSPSAAPPLKRGFAWLWHDLTTLEPYDVELAYADRSSLSGAHSGSHHKSGGGDALSSLLAARSNAAGVVMSETAALHILASVTQRAKKLFGLMATKQLESIREHEAGVVDENGVGGAVGGTGELQRYGMGYGVLFNAARDNFIATNDTALGSLLGEFRDHGLVLSAQTGVGGGGEVLWIPLRRERLSKVLQRLQDE